MTLSFPLVDRDGLPLYFTACKPHYRIFVL
jgi:hypothetical protein